MRCWKPSKPNEKRSQMDRNQVFFYYRQLCDWKLPIKKKVKMLMSLLECAYDDHWRVIGISKEALNVFKVHNFKKVSRMGINRGHIYDRNETLTYMLEHPFNDADEWWDFFYSRDRTILMTSTENMSNKVGDYFEVPEGLFHTQGFAWKHGKEEVDFLTELAHA